MAFKEKISLNEKRNVTLTSYIVDDRKRAAILICPGGAYTDCDPEGEKPLAEKYNELGFNSFVLGYSVGQYYKWPYPLEDFDQAMQYIIDNKDKYHVDEKHIATLGLSAGGHLVATACSIAKYKPFAGILAYPVTLKSDVEYTAPGVVDAVSLVNEDTSPCFILASRNDWIVPVRNSLSFVDALQKNFIDYEMHILGYSFHGYSFGKGAQNQQDLYCGRVENWVGESAQWLNELISGRYVSIRKNCQYLDLHNKYITKDNSCKLVFSNKESLAMIKEKFPMLLMINEQIEQKVGHFTDNVSLKQAVGFAEAFLHTKIDLDSIDKELNKIKLK